MVRRLVAADWQLLRQGRLEALSDSPEAFGETYAQATELDEQDWRRRIATCNWWVVEQAGTVEAMAALKGPRPATSTFDLMAVWTRPETRRRGYGSEVVKASILDAFEQGGNRVVLFVVDDNGPAQRLYERCGFIVTGKSKPIGNGKREVEMLLDLPRR